MIYEFESKRPKIDPSAYISDSAIVIGDVTIGARCYVGPGAVIRGDERPIYIGDESAVEDLCVIHVGGPDAKTDGCHIGKRVTIGHGAMVHGNYIRDGANIGMGAIVSLFRGYRRIRRCRGGRSGEKASGDTAPCRCRRSACESFAGA